MIKRGFILIALVLTSVVLAVLLSSTMQIGPSFRGRKLSAWLVKLKTDGAFNNTNDVTIDESAIRQIGTNGLATLLRMAMYHDSWPTRNMLSIFSDEWRFRLGLLSEDDHYSLARDGFNVLGPLAKTMVPVFISNLNQTNKDARDISLDMLAAIGPAAEDAVPQLAERFNREGADFQRGIVEAFGSIRAHPEVVVPLLTNQLENPVTTKVNRIAILIALGNYGSEASQAVPEVCRMLDHADPPTRIYATNALEKIKAKSPAILLNQ